MVKLSSTEDFAQNFDFVYANTDELKRQCYLTRYQVFGASGQRVATHPTGLDIDHYDSSSIHILMRDRATKEIVATIRVIKNNPKNTQQALPSERAAIEPMYLGGRALSDLPRESFSEISRLAIKAKNFSSEEIDKLTLCMHLAAIAVARLDFHHFTVTRMNTDSFKYLRSMGVRFEHANRLIFTPGDSQITGEPSEAIYYLDVETGLARSSQSYGLSEHILNEIAHQLHMPTVMESDDDSVQSA